LKDTPLEIRDGDILLQPCGLLSDPARDAMAPYFTGFGYSDIRDIPIVHIPEKTFDFRSATPEMQGIFAKWINRFIVGNHFPLLSGYPEAS
jgi:hypothetical protein